MHAGTSGTEHWWKEAVIQGSAHLCQRPDSILRHFRTLVASQSFNLAIAE